MDPSSIALAEYGELLVYVLDEALLHADDFEIMNINDLCRCVFTRSGGVSACMLTVWGRYLLWGMDGLIYPCYRFVGMPEWVMGTVFDTPSIERH